MLVKISLPILSVLGLVFAVITVKEGEAPMPNNPPVRLPPMASPGTDVAGVGVVESSTENIAIGTPVAGVVAEVFGRVGETVKAGQPLFEIEGRTQKAEVVVRRAALAAAEAQLAKLERQPRAEDIPPAEARLASELANVAAAQARLERLRALPRAEDIPPAEAVVAQAESALADARDRLALWTSVTDKRAVSRDELNRREYAVRTAQAALAKTQADLALLRAGAWEPDLRSSQAELAAAQAMAAQAQADLDLIRAGAWAPDIAIAQAEVVSAKARLAAAEVEVERLTVRSPVDGQILRVDIRVGEFAMAGVMSTPLMVVGAVEPLHLRVDIDEGDAWRVTAAAPATASVRGNGAIRVALEFVRFEPLVRPKQTLTGAAAERVDTRVLQIVYRFRRGDKPIRVGQLMDVFIDGAKTSPETAQL